MVSEGWIDVLPWIAEGYYIVLDKSQKGKFKCDYGPQKEKVWAVFNHDGQTCVW